MHRYGFPVSPHHPIYKANNHTYSNSLNNNNKYFIKQPENSSKNNDNINSNINEAIFDFLGKKIYLDDLLILLLLLFLYEEGIQDEYLFIALILLLLN